MHAMALYNSTTLLDPSCFSFLYQSMPDERLLKDAPLSHRSTLPTNTVSLHFPKLTSLSVSNQDAILMAAIGGAQLVPPVPPPLLKPVMSMLGMQSGQLPGEIPASCMQLAPTIAAELKDNTIKARVPFIDHLLPHDRSPFTINKKLYTTLANKSLYNLALNCFIPTTDYKEGTVCTWMNDIGKAMEDTYNVPIRRRWYHGMKTLPPGGSHFLLKPDIVLLDNAYFDIITGTASRVNWLQVRAFTKVTSEKATPQRMPTTIDTKSYVMLTYQFDHRFVLALSITGLSKYTVMLTDREGQICFHGSSLLDENRENTTTFLRILSFLMFGSLSDIGLDPHFITDLSSRAIVAVMVDNRRFEISQRLYTLENLLSQGTKVWVVKSNNEKYILKDS
jgi:Fungal protein kinase